MSEHEEIAGEYVEISGDEMSVLRCINAASSFQSLTVYEIAELIDMPLDRVALALEALMENGLIEGEERSLQ